MSFVAPTTNIVAITSGAQTIASGTITITLNVRNAPNFTSNNFIMDVTDLGSIEIDFNYIEDIGDVNEFTINVPRLEFEMRDTIIDSVGSNDESFVELITSLDAADLIVAKFEFNSGSEFYYTTREQCEFSYKERKVKLQMQHPLKYGAIGFGKTWDATTFSGKYVDVFFDDGAGTQEATNNSLYTKDLIVEYLDALSDNASIKYYSELYDGSYTDVTPIEDQIVVLGGDSVDRPDTDFSIATNRVRAAALSEAAMIGNVLGYGFFVPRYSKNSETESTISSDDLEELELDISFKNVRYYSQSITYGDRFFPTANFEEVSVSNQLINDLGQNNVNVIYDSMTGFTGANWDSFSSAYLYGGGQWGGLPAGFGTKILNTFKRIFRIADGSPNVDAGSYISGTILGIDKLKPYEYFSVGSGVHPLVDNKDFRPSYLKYNLINDTIEFEAYEF